MDVKKVIVCDLDGTLAESKADLSFEMADILGKVLERHYLAVISGGAYDQFQKQFLVHLTCSPEVLKNLYLFPTMGATCYVYSDNHEWQQVYEESLSENERGLIKKAIEETIAESGMDFGEIFAEQIDDRGTQVTFSALGQNAPLEIKEAWDNDQAKRRTLVALLEKKIPQFEVRIGGATSIDVTKKGVDKAFAIAKVKEILRVRDEDIIFIGDALYKGGNDAPVKKTDIDYIETHGPNEAEAILRRFL
jgi:phosphomannomutase